MPSLRATLRACCLAVQRSRSAPRRWDHRSGSSGHKGASREGVHGMQRHTGPAKLLLPAWTVSGHTRVFIAGGAGHRKADVVGVNTIDIHIGPRRTGVEGSSWGLRTHGRCRMSRRERRRYSPPSKQGATRREGKRGEKEAKAYPE